MSRSLGRPILSVVHLPLRSLRATDARTRLARPPEPLESLGPWALLGILLIVFAECGLLIGFFLPGDSLLFVAGLLVATGFIDTNIALVCLLITIAAVAGNIVGYWIGRKAGPTIFSRPDSRLFRQEYVDRTQHFFDHYGARAIVLARFVPIVRTFITVMAGGGTHGLAHIRHLQHDRRRPLGDRRHAARLLPRQHGVHRGQHRTIIIVVVLRRR